MKQAINFLSVYQNAQPKFSAKHVLFIWFVSITFMCLWSLVLLNTNHAEQKKLSEIREQNIRYAAQLRKISNQFKAEYGQSLSESIKALAAERLEKEQRLKAVYQLQNKSQDLTYYLNKIAGDHVVGTLIDYISIQNGQEIKIIGRSTTPQLVPKVLSSWENVKLNGKKNASQFKIQKMQDDKKYVDFVIQVQ
tara:strand:- start:71710 stop:72288 length:579 start_codon:yes stop_codon:yes gene_type:complete